MNTKTITIGAILLIVILLFAGGCSSYNGMVDADQAVSKQWVRSRASISVAPTSFPTL